MGAVISAEGVSRVYNRGRPDEIAALDGVDFEVPEGEALVLRGASGSGKSTLLGVAGCMVRPTAGRIRVLGREVASLPEDHLTLLRRATFGFVFQQFNLIRGLSALENILIPLYPLPLRSGAMRSRGRLLLDRFGLAPRAGVAVERLSGGEQQRVAIARALVNDPRIVIADEPSAHLDRALTEQLLALLEGIVREGRTVVIASHDPAVCDHPFVRTVVDLRNGRVTGVTRR
jgi:putative ABC transport system ATP-binding protein